MAEPQRRRVTYPNGDTTRIPDGPCQFCGAYPASLHTRPPGPARDLPAAMRGKYIRHCEEMDCRIAAANRIRAAGFDCPHMPSEAA